jgi:hypothetical protein
LALIAIGVGVGVSVSNKNRSKNSTDSNGNTSNNGNSGNNTDNPVSQTDPNDPSTFQKDPRLKQSFYGLAYSPNGVIYPQCGAVLSDVITDIQLMSQLTKVSPRNRAPRFPEIRWAPRQQEAIFGSSGHLMRFASWRLSLC